MNADVLALNDKLTVWINNNASAAQQFRALQDSEYDSGGAYDQSITISTALGSLLGPIYVQGRQSGALPLTSALINSQTGSSGAYVSTGTAKATYSYPRPFLPSDPATPAVSGDAAGCAPATVNASSVQSNRVAKSYATPTPTSPATAVAGGTGSTGSGSKLASTGVDAVPIIALSAGALVVGGLLAGITADRRRRAQS